MVLTRSLYNSNAGRDLLNKVRDRRNSLLTDTKPVTVKQELIATELPANQVVIATQLPVNYHEYQKELFV